MASGRNVVRTLVILILLGALLACSKPPAPGPQVSTETQQPTGLDSIPDPDPAKYPKLMNMADWSNPYLVVREDGIGLVDLSNREIHILKPEEVQATLVSLPSSAWPYGRVVLVTEALPQGASDQTKSEIRKNRGLLVGTLKELNVSIKETP